MSKATLMHQAGLVGFMVGVNLEGVVHDESLVQPGAGGNCMNWVLGHLTATYDSILPLLGQEQVMRPEQRDRYKRGSEPVVVGDDATDLDELRAAWDLTAQRVGVGLEQLPEARLAEPTPVSPTGNPNETVGSLLALIMLHQGYHAGQLGVLRRIVGKEGAIR